MCGIFGYKGSSFDGAKIVLSGLKKLDYRGYDSWGVGVISNNKITVKKDVGKVENVFNLNLPKGNVALSHTRWATTGGVTKNNAHPHISIDQSFALVHNGIVENFEELKVQLIKQGYKFISETDTEVIVRLIESQKNINLIEAIRFAFLQLKGRNTIAVLDSKDNRIIALRNGSPLIVGKNNFEYFISSDVFSMSGVANEYVDLDNLEMVIIEKKIEFFEVKTGKKINKQFLSMDVLNMNSSKGKYKYFMIKEIMETPKCIENISKIDKELLKNLAKVIVKSKRVFCLGSGSAGIAAAQIAYYLKVYAHVLAIDLVGSQASDYFEIFDKNDLIIVSSQSGETSDVIKILEVARAKGVKIASLVNMPGSMISRLSDYKFSSNCGPEICVMSTKVFVAQICFGYLLAMMIVGKYIEAIDELKDLSQKTNLYLTDNNNHNKIKKIAKDLSRVNDIFVLGKGQNFELAQEGMVKLIEGTYKHAHAILAGDLKHYAITLIDKNVFSIVLYSQDTAIDLDNAVNEIRARGGKVVGLNELDQNNFDYFIPTTNLIKTSGIFNIIPLQLLTYYMAVKLKNNVDKPRNIAKCVTVG